MTSSTLLTTTRRAVLAAALAASMVGCATRPAPVNLTDTIASTPALSTLNGLVNQAGLADTLKTSGPFTVFAPTNDAFKAVPAKTMDDWVQHPQKLKDVLSYHVIAGKTLAADVKNSDVKTLNGATVALSRAGDFVTIESAAVTQADLTASNGVLHLVDAVLMPPVKK